MKRRPLAPVAFVLVVLAACSRSSSVSVSTGNGTAPASATEDRAVAQRVVLQVVDLPGFEVGAAPVAAPGTADATSLQTASSFEACAGAAAALGDPARLAHSPGFFKGKTTLVSSLVVVAADEPQARAAMVELSRGELATCVTGLFRSVLSLDQIPGTSARTEPLGATAKAGDQSTTWRTTIEVTSADATVTAYSDITFVQTGRTLAVLFDFQVGEPFPAGERARLVKTLAERMD